MTKFRVGDIVRIKPNAHIPLLGWGSKIQIGSLCIIRKAQRTKGESTRYYVDLHNDVPLGALMWADEMEHDPFLMAVKRRRHG